MSAWETPSLTNWDAEYFWVCFNDRCEYFIRGWRWMLEKFNSTTSYRYRIDPTTGETGPLPVWSKDALKSGIITPGNKDQKTEERSDE